MSQKQACLNGLDKRQLQMLKAEVRVSEYYYIITSFLQCILDKQDEEQQGCSSWTMQQKRKQYLMRTFSGH